MVTLGGVDVSIDGIKFIDVTRCVELTGVYVLVSKLIR